MTLHALVPEHPFVARLRRAPCGLAAVGHRAANNAAALATADLLALAAALVLAGLLRAWVLGEPALVLGATWAVVPLYLGGAALARLFPGYGLGIVEELRRVCLVVGSVFALAVVGLWLAGPQASVGTASRLTLGVSGLLSLGLVPYARTQVKGWLVRRDRWGVPAVVYGAGPTGGLVVRQLQEERGMGYIPTAVFDDDPDRWGDYLDTVPVLGPTGRIVRDGAVAFLALPEAPPAQQIALLEGPLAHYGTVVIVPNLLEVPSLWVRPR
ncbi:MAG: hypothetical protein R3181_05290, partial [Rubricoccaceae bacterium]|nr:hypothetical protein [Rubricoccaceae bacterium]